MRKINSVPDFAMEHIGLAFGLVGELNKQLYQKAIEPLGISEQQLYILVALQQLGPQVQAHLSDPLKIDKATMVGLINDLESKELVQRRPHPNDRRAVLVHLTEGGQTMIQRGFQLSDEFTKRLFEGVSSEEQEILRKILFRLASNMGIIAEEMEQT